MTKIALDLPPDEARALAQLAKRFTHDLCKRLASRYDGGEEADAMWQGILKLQRALKDSGFNPR
jgi:hypothetical protein